MSRNECLTIVDQGCVSMVLPCCRFLLPFIRPYGGISWYIAGLSPTSAASLFAASLVNWERLAAGVNLSTMWLPVTPESSFCVGSVMWLLAVDVLLFAVLTWYCDKVKFAMGLCSLYSMCSAGWCCFA